MAKRIQRAIQAACDALIAAEVQLTELDRITGDGDLGSSVKRGAAAVEDQLESYPLDDVAATAKAIGHTLRRALGGSSGPLYGVLFLRFGNAFELSSAKGDARWAEALEAGRRAIGKLGAANPGDRTMLDALVPFVQHLQGLNGIDSREILQAAVSAAEKGAEATSRMSPRLGRSSYLGDRVLGHPDPGAMAVAIWLRASFESIFNGGQSQDVDPSNPS
jgi:triose/dihydroxyacetone kinase / FAD-AMP lyase (cyclizing)